MNKVLFFLLIGLVGNIFFAQSPEKYSKTITEKELKEMLYTYASDEFEGRDTGKEGQKKAVKYLKDFYVEHGILPAKDDGDYFQKVPLYTTKGFDRYIIVNDERFNKGSEVFSFHTNSSDIKANHFVYLGYGVDSDEYSDYENVDIKGKVVLIKSGEPKNRKGIYKVTGTKRPSKWSEGGESEVDLKLNTARNHGAKAIIIQDNKEVKELSKLNNQFSYSKINLDIPEENKKPVVFFVNTNVAKLIYSKFLKSNKPKEIKADLEIKVTELKTHIDSENVVAYIKGSEKPDEYLVISAHLDHVGMDADGNVFNGADDDGSGTIAILEIAEAFQKAVEEGYRPKRSVVFLHVTGEEKGLLGSEWYSQNPIFPMKKTIADLNIDMIGRIDPDRKGKRNYIYLIGSDKLSTELHNISEEVNKSCCNVELDYTYNDENDPNRFYYRSDHYNFAKHNVPIIFYFNGVHNDYHQITDTPDKINYDLLKNRAELVFYTAWELANKDKRLIVDKAK